jgi:PadR family transcriptional regulator, regulatory protein PadR
MLDSKGLVIVGDQGAQGGLAGVVVVPDRGDGGGPTLTIRRYLPIVFTMRRKPGTLLPLEVDILDAGLALRRTGTPHFYGFQLAKSIVDRAKASTALTAHGTLYKALARLEGAGLLTSTWEAPDTAAADGRPRRRLYEITGAGERALASHQAQHTAPGRARPAAGLGPA